MITSGKSLDTELALENFLAMNGFYVSIQTPNGDQTFPTLVTDITAVRSHFCVLQSSNIRVFVVTFHSLFVDIVQFREIMLLRKCRRENLSLLLLMIGKMAAADAIAQIDTSSFPRTTAADLNRLHMMRRHSQMMYC